jgi:RimJ/RimL family protein N-acetyltransferase
MEVLMPTDVEKLRLRPARAEDVVLFYGWANDREVRKQAFNTSPIPWSTHQAWFAGKLRATGTRLFVLEASSLPVGQIRFDAEGEELRIDYSLDEAVRGRGWGAHLVAKGVAAVRKILPGKICGVVKLDNKASQSVFERLGFRRNAGPQEGSAIFSLESTGAHFP